jgi:flagellar basal-body rod modification protein FlgD
MQVGGISSSIPVVDPADIGFGGLKAEDFLEMLIVELKNQDPTEPMTNDQLLTQISTIQGLQSNVELADAIKATTNAQQLATGAGFIGKQVTAAADGDGTIEGVVERAYLADGKVFVSIGGRDVPLDDVHSVNAAA